MVTSTVNKLVASNGFPMGSEKRVPRRPLTYLRRELNAVFPLNTCDGAPGYGMAEIRQGARSRISISEGSVSTKEEAGTDRRRLEGPTSGHPEGGWRRAAAEKRPCQGPPVWMYNVFTLAHRVARRGASGLLPRNGLPMPNRACRLRLEISCKWPITSQVPNSSSGCQRRSTSTRDCRVVAWDGCRI